MPEIKHGETSDLTKNNVIRSDVESDEDDNDHPSSWSKKSSTTSGSVVKRSSPMQVYTYKVSYFRGCMC